MTTNTKPKLRTREIWLRGGVATAIAAIVNVALAAALAALVGASPAFLALQPGPVATATIVTMVGGTLVFVVLNRTLERPTRLFPALALGVAVVSLIAPIALSMDTSGTFAGATPAAALALIPLHLIPALALVAAFALRPIGARA